MKFLLLIGVMWCIGSSLHAQDIPDMDFKLKKKSDFRSNEEKVLRIADFILASPVTDERAEKKQAGGMLIEWMNGTPDFSFVLDETLVVFSKDYEPAFLPILASMVKYTLQHKDKAADQNEVKRNTYKVFLEYCENPANNVQQTKEIKAGIDAKNAGNLDTLLKI
jgi:hypothetical protein